MKTLGAWNWAGWIVTLGLAAGCVREAAPTVEYFRSHADERQAQLEKCSNNAGSLGDAPGCVNAREAERMESIGSLNRLPPMGLNDENPPAPREDEQAAR